MMTENHSEKPAGAEEVDEELTAWEELLEADEPHVREEWEDGSMDGIQERWGDSDSERVREEWAAGREDGTGTRTRTRTRTFRGSDEYVEKRMAEYEARFPDPVEDASVIRVICGALDPRTFNSKIRWAAVIVTLMLGVLIPFMLGRHLALWAGVPSMWAAIIGGAVTVAYWKYF